MKLWVGVTDKSWFEQLAALAPDEVNFWQPSGSRGSALKSAFEDAPDGPRDRLGALSGRFSPR